MTMTTHQRSSPQPEGRDWGHAPRVFYANATEDPWALIHEDILVELPIHGTPWEELEDHVFDEVSPAKPSIGIDGNGEWTGDERPLPEQS